MISFGISTKLLINTEMTCQCECRDNNSFCDNKGFDLSFKKPKVFTSNTLFVHTNSLQSES